MTDVNDRGRVIIVEGNGLWRDHRITLVEGTTYDFEVIEAGSRITVRTLDGTVLVRDRGSIVWEFTVDTKGDADLGNDVFLSGEGRPPSTGRIPSCS